MNRDKFVSIVLNLPRVAKRAVALLVDASLCVLTVWLAFCLRLGEWVALSGEQWLPVVIALLIALPIFVVMGLYRAIFRYAGISAFITVLKAVAIYGLAYMAIFMAISVPGVPRTVGVLQPLLLLIAIGLLRVSARYWLGSAYQGILKGNARAKVLIYGAGSSGRQLAAALASSAELKVVGYLDDDPRLKGSIMAGLPIHDPADLPGLVETHAVRDVLLAISSASRERRNEVLDKIRMAKVTVRTLPDLTALAQGKITVSDLRELDIEDLLGRDAIVPRKELLEKNIRGKIVMVTGAGGSIGSELCRQIIRNDPSALLLVEQSEFALYTIHAELSKLIDARGDGAATIRLMPFLSSVRDAERMRQIMAVCPPHTLYHAAAYKHVPLVEQNIAEGIKNNVLGTLTAAQVASERGVSDFVLISTDKAVRPTNVMGASKRLAEMVLQAIAASGTPSSTNFSMVRFGNVLGSSGSVVPLFRQQIREGGPVTITHPEITRYFMTIAEASQLVIQAGAMSRGGDVFLLDMGAPVKIADLARRMVELSGLTVRDDVNPDGDIELSVTGLRPGEKLYEELLIGENPQGTAHPRIMKAHEAYLPWNELQPKLERLVALLDENDIPSSRALLKELVAGYVPDATVVDPVFLKPQPGTAA